VAATLGGLILMASACTGPGANNVASITPQSSPSSSPPPVTVPSPSPSPSTQPSASTLSVAGLPVHNGEVGIGYLAVTLTAAGGAPPYTWAVAGGKLPPGLSLSPAGVITGKNTTSGKFPFQVKVTDSAGATSTGTTTIGVFAALAVSQPCGSLCWVGMDCTTCGRFGGVSGGLPPYRFKVVGGAVPSGMTLSGLTLAGAFPLPLIAPGPIDVVGPPVPVKITFNLTVQVSDVFGASRNVTGNWQLFGPIDLSCPTDGTQCISCPSTNVAGDCSDNTIQYRFGSPDDNVGIQIVKVCDGQGVCATTPTAIAAALPPGWTATADGGTVSVSMSCNSQCPNGNGGFGNSFYSDVYFQLVDNGRNVAPVHKLSTVGTINIDI
jgi:putative Ig domain-containing protein